MIRDYELKRMTLEQLQGIQGALEASADPYAGVALRMVKYEIRVKCRIIRDRCRIVRF